MLLFFGDESAWTALPDEERNEAIGRIGAWYGELAGSGRIVSGGRLQGKSAARHVRLGPARRSGKPTVADGPFVEARESIGSYCVIEAPDIDAALGVAASWPGGGAVQVSPLQEG